MGHKLLLFMQSAFLFSVMLFAYFGYGQTENHAILNSSAQEVPDDFHPIEFQGFEENKGQIRQTNGQTAWNVRFLYRGEGGLNVYLLEDGIAYQFNKRIFQEEGRGASFDPLQRKEQFEKPKIETYRVDLRLNGANTQSTVRTGCRSHEYTEYQGDGVRAYKYASVTYEEVYPGIDWVVYVTQDGKVKYDFVVKPGANPNLIRLEVKHAEELTLNKKGTLTLGTRLGFIKEEKPESYQGGKKIASSFVLEGNLLYFHISGFSGKDTLVIDPTVVWGTYYGGTGADNAYGCAIDGSGNVYLSGNTASSNDIADGGYQTTFGQGGYDAFLVKFNSSGVRQWATYYGGSGNDVGYSCAVDAAGNIYLCGFSSSSTDISSTGAHQSSNGGGTDAFLVKFNSSGGRLWATYYGGAGSDRADECTVDGSGNVYLSGYTTSNTNIATSGAHQTSYVSSGDAFLVKFDSTGSRQWGTYYGGSGDDNGKGCMADGSGNVYLCGFTTSNTNISSSGAYKTGISGSTDAYLVKFNSSGVRQWATYYGGTGSEYIYGGVVDGSGNIYISGATASSTGISTGSAHQATYGGGTDALLAKFNSSGGCIWATYYGGSGSDNGYKCTVDGQGNLYLCGSTASSNGIAKNGFQSNKSGSNDAFLGKFDSSGTLEWGTYCGGTGYDNGYCCAVDISGSVLLGGYTASTNGISSSGAHQTSFGGGTTDAFLVKLTTAKTFVWSGSSSSWGTSGNWLEGEVPDSESEVSVLASSSNPVLDADVTVGMLYLDNSAYVDLNGYQLTVHDSLYGSGYLQGDANDNSSVLFDGAKGTLYMDQSTAGSTNRISSLKLDNGGMVILGNDLDVKDSAVLSSGTLSAQGNLNVSKLYIDTQALLVLGTKTLTVSDSLYGMGSVSGSDSSLAVFEGGGILRMDQTSPGSTNRLGMLKISGSEPVTLGNDLEIKDSVVLTSGTLNSGGYLKLKATDVLDYAQVAPGGTGTIEGDLEMGKVLSNTNSGWRQISIPVGTSIGMMNGLQLLGTSYGNAAAQNVYYWDASPATGNTAVGWVVANTSTDSADRAYVVFSDNVNVGLHEITKDWNISGDYEGGTHRYPIYATEDPNGGGSSDKSGWNLIPNPYPSNMDITQLFGASGFPSYKAVHVWDMSGGSQQFIGICSTGVSMIGYNNGQSTASTAVLSPYQAFWVKASTNDTLVLTDALRTTSMTGVGVLMKKNFPLLRINLLDAKSGWDQVVVYLHPEGKIEFSGATDAYKMFSMNGEVPALYLNSKAEGALSIKGLPEVLDSLELPLSIQNPQGGPIRLTPDLSDLSPEWEVYLKDSRDGSLKAIGAGDTLVYALGEKSEGVLFLVVKKKTNPGTGVSVKERVGLKSGQLQVGCDGKTIRITGQGLSWERSKYGLYDLQGKKVKQGVLQLEGGKGSIDLAGLDKGIYLLKVESGGESFTVTRY